jgi:hypothetical protein
MEQEGDDGSRLLLAKPAKVLSDTALQTLESEPGLRSEVIITSTEAGLSRGARKFTCQQS